MENKIKKQVCEHCWKAGSRSFEMFETVMLDEAVFRCLDEKMTTFTGIHYLFSDFESGAKDFYGCADKDHSLLGFAFGGIDDEHPDEYVGHLMFLRHADALSCVKKVEELIKFYHPEVKKFVADIPEFNWAAIRVAKKFGCVDKGEGNNGFVRHGKFVKTRLYVKEL